MKIKLNVAHGSVRSLSKIPKNCGTGQNKKTYTLVVGSGMSGIMEARTSKMFYSLPNSNFPLEPNSHITLWFPPIVSLFGRWGRGEMIRKKRGRAIEEKQKAAKMEFSPQSVGSAYCFHGVLPQTPSPTLILRKTSDKP